MTTTKLADNFTNMYPVSKTLRFELIPVGKTKEFIERDGLLDADFRRAESYKKVKTIIDRYHENFIEKVLHNFQLSGLQEYKMLYEKAVRDEKQEKAFNEVKVSLRKQISKALKGDMEYKKLFGKDLFKSLQEFVRDNKEECEIIKEFDKFTTYFTGFNQNRENMYVEEEKSTAIAYRIVNQNLPKYIDNTKIYSKVKECIDCNELDELLNNLKSKFDIDSIDEYFSIDGFNKVLSQKGIDLYTCILGAYSEKSGMKVRGLNELINHYNQHLPENGKKIPKLKSLYKQILSNTESHSFILESFENDDELINSVKKFCKTIFDEVVSSDVKITAEELLLNIKTYDLSKIYVANDGSISTISKAMFDDWSVISNAISNNFDMNDNTKNKLTQKYDDKKKKALKNVKYYSLKNLNEIVSIYKKETCYIEDYFAERIKELINNVKNTYELCGSVFSDNYVLNKALSQNEKAVSNIKSLLDSMKELQLFIKPFIKGQEAAQKDELFYSEIIRIWETIDPLTNLYNKVRNYVTRKPYSLEKVKLNFGKPTLLDGWDKNKETSNISVIMMKDGKYYLGIINPKCTNVIEVAPVASSDDVFQKMEYKLLPGPNKMLPKVFFSKSRIEEFAPDDDMLKKYNAGTHTKGDNFNLADCRSLIDFFKKSIDKHEDWSGFGFKFSDTEDYNDISEFYKEVTHQGYKITYRNIDRKYIDTLVENGQLYLFKIYNKDFSEYSKGTPNLHTMYWKMLFDEVNLKDVVYKLNGKAEVFFRKSSIKSEDIVRHEKNIPIKNKYPNVKKTKSTFEYDLVKDRRFTVDKFQFHVPVTMNFKAVGQNNFNRKVNRLIHDARDMHVIGIDRGERNLLYISVVDMNGKIKKQMSLNEIISYDKNNNVHVKDYHLLLDKREHDNKASRQNWTTVNTIKELKEGYLSQVIHVVAELMIEYNAIVVLEDLNFGFMRGRQKFEKQVYQKFEKMLIDKLNYLVDKKKPATEPGGLLHAYQLTDKFDSFQKLGKQSGFLFYVPAWNTSKIDPTTGFTNLFFTKYESVEKSKAFISKFDSVEYDTEKESIKFAVDYSKFTYKAEGSRTKWDIYSVGERIETYRNPSNNKWDTRRVVLTNAFKDLFEKYNVNWNNGDIKTALLEIDTADFYRHFMRLFSLVLQLRNSDSAANEDKIVSPVLNERGKFFETDINNAYYPIDADANGAYNIARKGLWIIEKIQQTDIEKLDKIKLAMSNRDWLVYAQENTL